MCDIWKGPAFIGLDFFVHEHVVHFKEATNSYRNSVISFKCLASRPRKVSCLTQVFNIEASVSVNQVSCSDYINICLVPFDII